MILFDSSMWIDYFRGASSPQADRLDLLLGREPLIIGDIVLAEVLRGFTTDRQFEQALALLGTLENIAIVDVEIAVQAARNFRRLRAKGMTVRKTTDTLIATRCIADGIALLYSDRDFDAFVEHLGLVSVMGGPA